MQCQLIGIAVSAVGDVSCERYLLHRLDQRPIRTVFILRLLLFLAPPLNYVLAMTNVRYRDYLIGSALGLVPGLLLVALLFDWVLSLIT